jgi:hypothetical protein
MPRCARRAPIASGSAWRSSRSSPSCRRPPPRWACGR